MLSLMRKKVSRRVGAVLGAVAILLTLSAAPASASTFWGPYFNPFNSGRIEGNYKWTDCGGCVDDHAVSVNNVPNGYHARVWLQADVYSNGVFYTYLDKVLNDGYSRMWKVPSTMPRVRIRLIICFYNSAWTYLGGCQTHYGYHSK